MNKLNTTEKAETKPMLTTVFLAPYLPYGLNCYGRGEVVESTQYTENPINKLLTITGMDANWVTVEGISITVDESIMIEDCMPILRPLTDIAKEIKINQDKFIPIYKLFEIEYKGTHHVELIREMYFNVNYTFTCSSHYGTAMECSVNTKNIQMNNYWKIQKLLEWHFDIYGLIEKGLAISIHDVE